MNNEKEEKVNKIQNAIMNSLANIYQKAEDIEKVDREKADWIVKKIEEIRKDIEDNNTQAIEFLSEIMLVQTEIINFLDTDNYKRVSVKMPKSAIENELATIGKQTISEEDKAALLQNQNASTERDSSLTQHEGVSKNMQIYVPQKKHFWQKILEKIMNLFGKKQEAC